MMARESDPSHDSVTLIDSMWREACTLVVVATGWKVVGGQGRSPAASCDR